MPYFSTDAEMNIDVDEFVSACSNREIEEIIKILRDEGHLTGFNDPYHKATSPMEETFENNVSKLSGNYHRLGADQIERIAFIANQL